MIFLIFILNFNLNYFKIKLLVHLNKFILTILTQIINLNFQLFLKKNQILLILNQKNSIPKKEKIFFKNTIIFKKKTIIICNIIDKHMTT